MDSDGPAWSEDVRQADWIAGRLTPWGRGAIAVTAVVPGGFERYARLLHPAADNTAADDTAADSTATGSTASDDAVSDDRSDGRPVRWAEVAAWSGLPLHARAQFHSVALPPFPRPSPPPYSTGPAEGTLDQADALALAGVLRAWTSTPDDCWFCVWDGFGWDSASRLVAFRPSAGEPARTAWPAPPADPVPGPVRDGPRVRLPHRDYLLYRGPAEAVTATAGLSGTGQTANLWWPADRAWCVATEIDLRHSYVGGPPGLIEALCADARIEALPARADDTASLVLEDWVTGWVDGLTDALLARGTATLATARGTVRARLDRPAGPAGWRPRVETSTGGDGQSSSDRQSSSDSRIATRGAMSEREQVAFQLTHAILALAHG